MLSAIGIRVEESRFWPNWRVVTWLNSLLNKDLSWNFSGKIYMFS